MEEKLKRKPRRTIKALSKPIEFCGKHPFATGVFAILSLMGLFLSVVGFKLDRLESQIASQQVLEVQDSISEVDKKVGSVSDARYAEKRANISADNATKSANQQFMASNANALRLSRYLITSGLNLDSASAVYFFEPDDVINKLDRRRVSVSQNTAPNFWGVCPYSMIECYRDIKLPSSVRPQAVIQTTNEEHSVHEGSFNAFRKVCTKFDDFSPSDLGYELCVQEKEANNIEIPYGETLRFSGTPEDGILVLFVADGKLGAHFGTSGSSYPFNIWLRDENGMYSRIDDRKATKQENYQQWFGGDYIALVVDSSEQPIEAVTWDGYGNRAQIQSGASINRFKFLQDTPILKKDTGLTFRTNRTDLIGSNGEPLPDVLEVCVEQNGEFDC